MFLFLDLGYSHEGLPLYGYHAHFWLLVFREILSTAKKPQLWDKIELEVWQRTYCLNFLGCWSGNVTITICHARGWGEIWPNRRHHEVQEKKAKRSQFRILISSHQEHTSWLCSECLPIYAKESFSEKVLEDLSLPVMPKNVSRLFGRTLSPILAWHL